ncbi:hypothetical protein [Edaphocola flava]|uniref:hypothetical protein n=1 Tax=Edaphocola flava TaxID=2499629 RepID=UPI00100B079F|nr:hypothetical protein [Edaphocola flava]
METNKDVFNYNGIQFAFTNDGDKINVANGCILDLNLVDIHFVNSFTSVYSRLADNKKVELKPIRVKMSKLLMLDGSKVNPVSLITNAWPTELAEKIYRVYSKAYKELREIISDFELQYIHEKNVPSVDTIELIAHAGDSTELLTCQVDPTLLDLLLYSREIS